MSKDRCPGGDKGSTLSRVCQRSRVRFGVTTLFSAHALNKDEFNMCKHKVNLC